MTATLGELERKMKRVGREKIRLRGKIKIESRLSLNSVSIDIIVNVVRWKFERIETHLSSYLNIRMGYE